VTSESVTSGNDTSLDSIIQGFASGFGGNINATGPFNVNATFGLGDQGSNPFVALLQQLIPAAFNGLTGHDNNMNLTGVPGQSPFSFGLGFSPVNGTGAGEFDFTSIFSQILGPFSSIVSTFLGGGNITAFPIPFPGAGSPSGQNGTFPSFSGIFPGFNGSSSGFNGTFPSSNGTFPSFGGSSPSFNGTTPSFPEFNGTAPPFSGDSNSTLPDFGPETAFPSPTFTPTVLPPTDVASSIEEPLPTEVSSSTEEPLPTDTSDPIEEPLPTEVSSPDPATPTESVEDDPATPTESVEADS
jgi:hypothetical protein